MDIGHIRAVIANLNTAEKVSLSGGGFTTAAIDAAKIYATKLTRELGCFFTRPITQMAMGCSFSTELCSAVYNEYALDAMRHGEAFAGVIDAHITRDPFDISAADSFSEDAFLTSELIKACMSKSPLKYILAKPLGGGFANRTIDERALNEIYLKPYYTTAAQAGGLLLDSGTLNGDNISSSRKAAGVFTRALSPSAVLFTDYYDNADTVACLKGAGAYQLGQSREDRKKLEEAVRLGNLEDMRLNKSIENLVNAVAETHEFYKNPFDRIKTADRDITQLTSVLLKNEGVLPTAEDNLRFVGDCSAFVDSAYFGGEPISVKQAIRIESNKLTVVIIDGSIAYDNDFLDDLKELTTATNTVIICCNLPMALPTRAKAVLFVPSPDKLSSVVKILTGAEPYGRLPFTWAVNQCAYPMYADKRLTNRGDFRVESVYTGHAYFTQFSKPVAFPFGAGLSYASYEVTKVKFTANPNYIRAKCTVKNTSTRAGTAVILLAVTYLGDAVYGVTDRLGASKRVSLNAGESLDVVLEAKSDSFAAYDSASRASVAVDGKYACRLKINGESVGEGNVKFSGGVFSSDEKNTLKSYFPTYSKTFMPTACDVEKRFNVKFIAPEINDALYELNPSDKRVKKLAKLVLKGKSGFEYRRTLKRVQAIPPARLPKKIKL